MAAIFGQFPANFIFSGALHSCKDLEIKGYGIVFFV